MEGKARKALLERITRLVGRLSSNILIPPNPSIDAGAERLMGLTRVYATDPSLGVPLDDLGYFAFHFPSSDVAVLGAEPRIMTSAILLPSGFEEDKAVKIADDLNWEAYRYDVSIITGHTGWYDSINEPVVVTTVIGETRKVISPKSARSGDILMIIGIPGAEFLYEAAHFKPEILQKVSDRRAVERWKRSRWMLTAVDKARDLAMFSRVNGMKDGAEGGMIRLFNDFADASGLGFVVRKEKFPFPPELIRLGDTLGFDPLAASSSGVVLAAIPRNSSIDFLKELMESHGFPVSIVGELKGKDRYMMIDGKIEDFPLESRDPYLLLKERG